MRGSGIVGGRASQDEILLGAMVTNDEKGQYDYLEIKSNEVEGRRCEYHLCQI